MTNGFAGFLPGGYWDSSALLHREFQLAVLTGREEELLAEANPGNAAAQVTALLSRCVRRLGHISPVSRDLARQLLVADRQYLLLRLRQLTFGDLVRANLFCPWPECGKRISIEFSIDGVPVSEPAERAPFYTLTLSPDAFGDGSPELREISFRLPNGGDQEAVSPLLTENEARAFTLLLTRCILGGGTSTIPAAEVVESLSPLARAEIEAEMRRLAPAVELDMETECPECARPFVAPFDLQRFFFGELRTDKELLYQQVHYLAYHYHWSEREIMGMAREKRLRYIDVLAGEIERMNRAG